MGVTIHYKLNGSNRKDYYPSATMVAGKTMSDLGKAGRHDLERLARLQYRTVIR